MSDKVVPPARQRTWLEVPDSYDRMEMVDMVEINSDDMCEILLLRLWSVFRPDRKFPLTLETLQECERRWYDVLLPFFRALCDLDNGVLVLVPFVDCKPKSHFYSVEKFSRPIGPDAPFLVCTYATTAPIVTMIETLEAPGPEKSPERPGTMVTLARIIITNVPTTNE